jgi:RimJ/RimL family protein N-acetyltransferase
MEKRRVVLTPLGESDYQAYLTITVPAYAQEHIESGRWTPSEALQKAQEEYQELLPDGLATKDQYLFSIEDADTGKKVGILWFEAKMRGSIYEAFLYDFLIFEHFRRQGYGLQAMSAFEEELARLHIHQVRLHVFGHNYAARALYEKLGYRPASIIMLKQLDGNGS